MKRVEKIHPLRLILALSCLIIWQGLSTATAAPDDHVVPTVSTSGAGSFEYPKRLMTDYTAHLDNLLNYDWLTYAAVVTGTLALMPYDQSMVDGSREYAVRHKFKKNGSPYGSLGQWHLMGKSVDFSYPKNMLALFWYMGDGLFSLQLAAGFTGYGFFASDLRGSATAVQIFDSLLVTSLTIIPIKMATGRESPQRSSVNGGRWHGYPGLKNYINNQSRFYAFPSGHVATAVSTLTVIAENYPEKSWIIPVGSPVVGLLMYSLMNVGSHWPSDFPLAVLIGYTAAHTVVANHKQRRLSGLKADNLNASIKPGWQWEGVKPYCDINACVLDTQWRF